MPRFFPQISFGNCMSNFLQNSFIPSSLNHQSDKYPPFLPLSAFHLYKWRNAAESHGHTGRPSAPQSWTSKRSTRSIRDIPCRSTHRDLFSPLPVRPPHRQRLPHHQWPPRRHRRRSCQSATNRTGGLSRRQSTLRCSSRHGNSTISNSTLHLAQK